MAFIRLTAILSILAWIVVSPAISQDASSVDEEAVRRIVQSELEPILQDLRSIRTALDNLPGSEGRSEGVPAEPVEPPEDSPLISMSEAEAVGQFATQSPSERQQQQDAVDTQYLKAKILKHYRDNISGTKSRSANPRKAVELFEETFREARRRLDTLDGDSISAVQQEQMLEQLRSKIRSFFDDNSASASDWQSFLRGIDTEVHQGFDATKKESWIKVLDELAVAFREVATEIQKEEAKNPFVENRGITAGRSSSAATGGRASQPPPLPYFHHPRRFHWYYRIYGHAYHPGN